MMPNTKEEIIFVFSVFFFRFHWKDSTPTLLLSSKSLDQMKGLKKEGGLWLI